jgi:hypothetical protein
MAAVTAASKICAGDFVVARHSSTLNFGAILTEITKDLVLSFVSIAAISRPSQINPFAAHPVALASHSFGALLYDLDETEPNDSLLQRVVSTAHKGYFARAVAALSIAKVAPANPETLAALQLLHPVALTPPVMHLDLAVLPVPHKTAVRATLHSFTLGSSGGASALTPALIKDALSIPGSQTLEAFTAAFPFFIGKPVPSDVRQLLFGARLVGLVKAAGPPQQLRPIASGDTFRRAGGKFLMRSVNDEVRDFLLKHMQFGVSVPRAFSANLQPGHVIVTLDFRNAYNSLLRAAFLRAVQQHFPVLMPYALASYANHTSLIVGTHVILSQCHSRLSSSVLDLTWRYSKYVP